MRFWIRVYTEVTTDQGLLHDDWNLGLVYEVLRFDPATPPAQRERRVAEAKARYTALLRRFAAGDTDNLTAHETRILHAFGDSASASDFRDAIARIRFQLGQADRFHDGLIRAAVWEKQIARTLAQHGVPPQIAALPHVESSFNLAAYSKVGAAGLWQFMPSTARRYMRVDRLVDERLDPYSATDAAANLMLYNYRLLGTWPLAVTAYNHGPGGLRRAQDELGTSDIAVIVKHFQGRTFGFASRNFYVAFLAALEVDRNAEKFFGPITRLPETQSTVSDLPDYIPIEALAKAFKVDMGALRVLNPALRPPIWSGARFVPRGYTLRVPGAQTTDEITAAWARLPPAQRYVAQRNDGAYRMRRGESLAGVAAASGVTLSRLLAANGWSGTRALRRGEVVHIPMPATRAEVSGSAAAESAASLAAAAAAAAAAKATAAAEARPAAAGAVGRPRAPPAATARIVEPPRAASPPASARIEESPHAAAPPAPTAAAKPSAAPASPATAAVVRAAPREPVSEHYAEGPALLPAATPTSSSDTTNYSVGAGDTVVVQAAETLGHFADWSGRSAKELRALNRMHRNATVTVGHKLKLDLSRVSAAQFTAARREYHRHLQEVFFATHRIAGTENYVIKRGDSLWTIAKQRNDLPVWLVTEYNPDVDFNDVRPGSSVTLPKVVDINRQ